MSVGRSVGGLNVCHMEFVERMFARPVMRYFCCGGSGWEEVVSKCVCATNSCEIMNKFQDKYIHDFPAPVLLF